jgi:hypothetical protein
MAAACVATAVTVTGVAASPAFAKSDSVLSGPRTARAGHAFRLTVSIGDDAGAKQASARLQVRGAHGRYHWYGTWHRLRRTDQWDESSTITVTERDRGRATFRAVVGGGYATTNIVTVAVR